MTPLASYRHLHTMMEEECDALLDRDDCNSPIDESEYLYYLRVSPIETNGACERSEAAP